ncbi:MAG: hypothetical protein K6E36_04925 [Oscillospiraceae bacterium]|nr:hypothetical protein [Oscillospiraceae bacterium]
MKQIMMKGKQRVKGTVLFTVVSVMMIMVVFLMSTLILTTSANRRSYYTYYHTQAEYAAQSALDCITNYAYSDKNFSDWVTGIADDGQAHEVFIEFKDTQMPLSDPNAPASNVRCTVQRESDNYIYDEVTKKIHRRDQWKIVATAVVGKGRNQTSCQKATYLYSNVRMPKTSTQMNKISYQLVKYDEEETSSSTWIDDPGSPFTPIANAVYSLAPTGTNDNVVVLGPQYSGMTDTPKGRTKYGKSFQDISNNVASVGDGIFVGSFRIKVNTAFVFQRKGEGLQYYGNLDFGNEGTVFDARIDSDLAAKQWSYQDENYVYVDGTVSASGGKVSIGYKTKAPNDLGNTAAHVGNRPVNLFAGALNFNAVNNGLNVCGDVYLYDPALDSTWAGFKSSTILRNFVEKEINKSSGYPNYSGTHGNLVCNNNKLTLGVGGDSGSLTIDGDLIFTNPTGHVEINAQVTVTGKAIFACPQGNVDVKSGMSLTAGKGTFYNNNETELKRILKASSGSETKIGNTALTSYRSNGRDYSLFPFDYRLDEIFDKYYRWDLAGDANWANDPLVKESKACGHDWSTKTFTAIVSKDNSEWGPEELLTQDELTARGVNPYDTNGGTTLPDGSICEPLGYDQGRGANMFRYQKLTKKGTVTRETKSITVPYTTPVDSSNVIIKAFEPLDASKAAATVSKRDDMSYSKIADFKNDMLDSTGKKLADPASVKGVNVSIEYAYPGASAMTKSGATDVYYVCEDCEINMSEISKPVFIDPSQASQLPLRVAIKGSVNNKVILINNTAQYKGGKAAPAIDYYYTDKQTDGAGKSYYNIFGRQDVYLFIESGTDLEKALIVTTGVAGGFENGVPGISKKLTLDMVSNPYYPDKDAKSSAWDSLSAAEKLKFLYVPNDCIFGEEKATYTFTNGGMFVGAVMMPYSTVVHKTQSPEPDFNYREDHDSVKVNPGANRACVCIGSMVVDKLQGENWTLMAYLGDGNRKGGRIEQKIKKTTGSNGPHDYSDDDPAFNGGNDYLSNDHQGMN